jgi:hypothetical protein
LKFEAFLGFLVAGLQDFDLAGDNPFI